MNEREGRLHNLRVSFLRIELKVFDGLRDDAFVQLIFVRERRQRGNDGGFGIHFEEAAEAFAGIAAAKTVGAKRGQASGNPGSDLVGDDFHVVGHGDEWALLVSENGFEIGFFRRFGGMEHVPALDAESVIAEEFVAGGTPNVC